MNEPPGWKIRRKERADEVVDGYEYYAEVVYGGYGLS
jgi:hypothetical protein